MPEYECSYCPFVAEDGWQALAHRDTHRGHPAVIEGTARMNAVLAALPESGGSE